MPFLNPAMLPWLMLASAPIIIHLINKNRHRVVDWGAMRFLEISVVTSARRLRLQEFILLIIRTMIVVLFVLAMARPYLPGVLSGGGTHAPRRNMIILLDRSMSMAHGRESLPRMARAKGHTEKLLGLLHKGDTASLILVDHRVTPVTPEPTAQIDRLRGILEGIKPSYGRADFARAFDEALRQLRLSSNPLREVYVITDGQAEGWHTRAEAQWEPIRRALQKMPQRPSLYVLPVEATGTDNLAITDVQLSRLAVGVYRPVKVDARVTNFSDQEKPSVNVHFSIDGKREATVQVAVKPLSSATPAFEYHFKEPGSHYVTVELDNDSLALDDARTFSIDVFQRMPVLLVNGAPAEDPFKSEVGFLALALAPKDSANPDFKDVVEPSVIEARDLPRTDLAQYHVVVLANVSSLPPADVGKLERFVEQGGGLLIAPGNLCDMDMFNKLFYADGDGLSPAKLLDTEGDDHQQDRFASVITAAFSHKALATFADPKQGDLSLIHAYKWFRLELPKTDHRAKVLCRFDNGWPFLAEREFGRGFVMLLAIPIDDDWSNLPRRSFYLPLMHQLVYYLGSGVQPPRNLDLGAPIVHLMDGSVKATEATVIDPAGGSHTVALRRYVKKLAATYDDTNAAGLYQVIVNNAGKAERTYYSVAPQQAESDLRPLTDENVRSLEEVLGDKEHPALFAKNWDELYQAVMSRSRADREIWRWLVAGALLLLALEIFLTGRWSEAPASPLPAAQGKAA